MPMPLSAISTTASPPSTYGRMQISPPSGVYFAALTSTFATHCPSRTLSADDVDRLEHLRERHPMRLAADQRLRVSIASCTHEATSITSRRSSMRPW